MLAADEAVGIQTQVLDGCRRNNPAKETITHGFGALHVEVADGMGLAIKLTVEGILVGTDRCNHYTFQIEVGVELGNCAAEARIHHGGIIEQVGGIVELKGVV